jgi:hypothetical protein
MTIPQYSQAAILSVTRNVVHKGPDRCAKRQRVNSCRVV